MAAVLGPRGDRSVLHMQVNAWPVWAASAPYHPPVAGIGVADAAAAEAEARAGGLGGGACEAAGSQAAEDGCSRQLLLLRPTRAAWRQHWRLLLPHKLRLQRCEVSKLLLWLLLLCEV